MDEQKATTAIVQPANFGDIINILPMAQIVAEKDGVNPMVYVSREKQSFLSGVSYVTPAFADPSFGLQVLESLLKKRHKTVLIPDVSSGKEKKCESFSKEAWMRCGMLSHWGTRLPVFDQRNKVREQALIKKIGIDGRPMVLINFSGVSGPFPDGQIVADQLRLRHDHIRFVNLAGVRGIEFYDLLGIFDIAKGLVTIDTGTLHLAGASSIPVCALIADNYSLWHGAVPLKNPQLTMRYTEVWHRMEAVHQWVSKVASC